MAAYYYLISSLPMLKLDEEPPLSLDSFEAGCSEWLSPKELSLLAGVNVVPAADPACSESSAAGKWWQWETCLRNRIAKHRASSLSKDADPYVLPEKDYYSEVERTVQEAFNSGPLEREKMFDKARWQLLESLESGHDFDFDKICIYKIKLMLLSKWQHRKIKEGKENLDRVIKTVSEEKSQ